MRLFCKLSRGRGCEFLYLDALMHLMHCQKIPRQSYTLAIPLL